MRRLLLFTLILSSSQFIFAQSINSVIKNPNIINKNFPLQEVYFSGEHSMVFSKPLASPVNKFNKTTTINPIGTKIGNTTYDLQTNSATPKRLLLLPGGNLIASWTGSVENSVSWSDRGTFYNYYNGVSWNAFPTNSLEVSIRTGWPAVAVTETGKEIVFSHDASLYKTVILTRPTAGTGSWTTTTDSITGIWGRALAGKGDTIHFINSNYCGGPPAPAFGNCQTLPAYCNQYTQYWRSPDGGITWDIKQKTLPGLDTANGVRIMSGDQYAIDRFDTTLAIVSGGTNTALRLWKSYNQGSTWDTTTIMTLIPNIDGFIKVDTPALLTNDGANEVLVDPNGIIHVWTGLNFITDLDSFACASWTFRPGSNGLLYWNSTMQTDSIQLIASTLDIDTSGDLSGIGTILPNYGTGLISSPSAAIDTASGYIYVVYVSIVENSDENNNPLNSTSFRDLFGIYSTDTGKTWSVPVNLTNSADLNYENVFPSVAKIANGKVHVMWQRDRTPGSGLRMSPITLQQPGSDIMYYAFDYSDFDTSISANFNHTQISPPIPNGTKNVLFSDSSKGNITVWDWDFGDGSPNSNQRNPTHPYAKGHYNVCLTVSTAYSDLVTGKSYSQTATFCDSVKLDTVFGLNVNTLNLKNSIEVFPNPSSGSITIDLSQVGAKTDLVEIYNGIGQKIYDERIATLKSKLLLNLNNFENGNYFIKLKLGDQFVTKQITLLK